MGNTVKSFVVDVGKAVSKGATSIILGRIPVVGTPVANWINSKYAAGGSVASLAGASAPVPAGKKTMTINTASQLIDLIKKAPDIAQKHGLSVDKVNEAVANAKEGEMLVAKKRGGRMKKSKKSKKSKHEDHVMLESGESPAFARGGLVPSVF